MPQLQALIFPGLLLTCRDSISGFPRSDIEGLWVFFSIFKSNIPEKSVVNKKKMGVIIKGLITKWIINLKMGIMNKVCNNEC